jgi:hypothetical protein
LVLHSATQSSQIQLMAKSPTSEMKATFAACSFHAAQTVACAFETLKNNSHLYYISSLVLSA